MGNKFLGPTEAVLSKHGFEPGAFDARKNATRWTRRGAPDIVVHGGIAEHAFRMIKRDVEKLDKIASISAVRKRNTTAIKARQQTERERLAGERARRKQELAEFEAAADVRMAEMSTSEWNAVCAEIERREREIREIERMMTETPNSGHKGAEHAKHRA